MKVTKTVDRATDHVDQLTTLSKAKGFLGREFLTWLWYTAETHKERLKIPYRAPGKGGDGTRAKGKDLEVDLWVDDRIALEGTASMSHHNVMKGGDPSHSREAAASLATGKTVREMKLGINVKDIGEFSAVLSCDDLNPRSLKLPSPGNPDGQATAADKVPLVLRLQAMDTFLNVLDGLFARFLAIRVAPQWEATSLEEVRTWIKKRQPAEDSATLH